ncbi:cytochrome P450 [Mycena rebaudengoi]|nr:cytochrome P450 [Mycena rebaudengoi]
MPYTIGLQSAASTFISAGFATHFTVAVVFLLGIIIATSPSYGHGPVVPTSLPGLSVFWINPFFHRRYDFLSRGFAVTGEAIFQFRLMRNTVVVLSGSSARRAFFYAKGFDLFEGFKSLSGGIPMVQGVTSGLHSRTIFLIYKGLAAVQKSAPLSALIPILLEDSRRVMESYGPSGTFDPFQTIYELIFQTTVRSITCSEIADDGVLVARLKTLYDRLDHDTTPAIVLVPWLPTPAMMRKLWATKKIYDIVVRTINARERSGIPQNDTLQMLLDSGDEKMVVVGFIMGLLIAGARSTGTTASWIITFLGGHSDWRQKAKAEIECLIAIHADPVSQSALSSQLASIPLEIWESQTPALDAIIRETLRMAQPHTAMRRNLGPEVYIDGKLIPSGAYVVYPFSDVHLDPELYPEPWRFDPSRKEPPNTDLAYVGWGVGKTTCLGTRLAKVELKLTTALFLLGFDHVVVDGTGDTPDSVPTPNWNDTLMCSPPKGSCYVKFKRTKLEL